MPVLSDPAFPPPSYSSVVRHLYVHIPFCPKVCPYCAFYKEASDRNKTQRFLDSVLAELDARLATMSVLPQTIFFGGGTPSALSTSQLDYLLTGLRARLDLSELQEWTLEMNPATVSLEKATLLRDLGVNRISMGVQSWDEELLKVLGRVHNCAQAERSYEILREAGFENINLDFIFAVPTQTREQWHATLAKTVALAPEHVSAYCLTYEEDTAFFARFQKGELTQDESWDADLFETTMDVLSGAGYDQYEISNYARPGRECRHNLAYWIGSDYLGLGPSAFSTVGETRWQNVAETTTYCDRILSQGQATSFSEHLDPETRRKEHIAFALRTNRGVERQALESQADDLTGLLDDGLLSAHGDQVHLTRRGKLLADAVAELFV